MSSHRRKMHCNQCYPMNIQPTCPAPENYPSETESKIIQYTIQPGDTLWALAAQYNTTVDEIIACNPGIDPCNLPIGQTILIPDPIVIGYTPWLGYPGGWYGGPWYGPHWHRRPWFGPWGRRRWFGPW